MENKKVLQVGMQVYYKPKNCLAVVTAITRRKCLNLNISAILPKEERFYDINEQLIYSVNLVLITSNSIVMAVAVNQIELRVQDVYNIGEKVYSIFGRFIGIVTGYEIANNRIVCRSLYKTNGRIRYAYKPDELTQNENFIANSVLDKLQVNHKYQIKYIDKSAGKCVEVIRLIQQDEEIYFLNCVTGHISFSLDNFKKGCILLNIIDSNGSELYNA